MPFMHMCMHLSSNTHTATHTSSLLLQMGTAKALTHVWLPSVYICGFHIVDIMYCSQHVIAAI